MMNAVTNHCHNFTRDCKNLSSSPIELWLCYVNKFFSSFSLFALSIVLVLHLHDLNFSDETSGLLYGLFGAVTSIYGLFTGLILDRKGVRVSIITGSIICTVGKIILGLTSNHALIYISLIFLIPVGEALSIPVLTTGVKRYTTKSNSPLAYGIYYSILNIGAAASGYIVDITRELLPNGFTMFGTPLSVYRILILFCAIANFIPAIIALCFVREIDVSSPSDPTYPPKSPEPILRSMKLVCMSKPFWKFMLLNLLLMNVRSIFKHMDATLPKYLQRTLGDGVSFGSIYAVNPLLVVFIAPIIQVIQAPYPPIRCITLGAWISSLSPLWLWMVPSVWGALLFVLQLSIGESIWSPRNMDYMMTVIPKGKEGIYIALTGFPMFFSKLPTGILSGWLLASYCPALGNCSPTIWEIISGIAVTSPLLMTMCYYYLEDEAPSHQEKEIQVVDLDKLDE